MAYGLTILVTVLDLLSDIMGKSHLGVYTTSAGN